MLLASQRGTLLPLSTFDTAKTVSFTPKEPLLPLKLLSAFNSAKEGFLGD